MHTQHISIFQVMGFMAEVELTCHGHLETTTQILEKIHNDFQSYVKNKECYIMTLEDGDVL